MAALSNGGYEPFTFTFFNTQIKELQAEMDEYMEVCILAALILCASA